MAEVNTFVSFSAVGVGETLNLPFTALDTANIVVKADGVVVSTTLYEFTTATAILTLTGFPVNTTVLVYSRTPVDADEELQSGSTVYDWELVNQQFEKSFMVLQEHRDFIDASIKTRPGAAAISNGKVPIMGADGFVVDGPTAAEITAAQGYAVDAQTAAASVDFINAAATTDDYDKMFVKHSGGSIRLAGKPFVNIMDHNAVGDGDALDTTAFTAACAAAGSDGLVFLPAGKTFAIGAVTISTSITIYSPGKGCLKRHPSAATGNWITVTAPSFKLLGVKVDGNKAVNANACHNILISAGCVDAQIIGNLIVNAKASGGYGDGLHFAAGYADDGRKYLVQDNEATLNDSNGIAASSIRGLDVVDNHSHHNGGIGINLNNYDVTLASLIVRSSIRGNRVNHNTTNGITVGNFVADNVVSGGGRLYGYANPDALNVDIMDNVVYNNGWYGIAAYGDYINILDNVIHNNGGVSNIFGGINTASRYSSVLGNKVYLNSSYGIDAGGMYYGVIKGNEVQFNCTNGGCGLNLEGQINVDCLDNSVWYNGASGVIQIEVLRNGSDGTNDFPGSSSGIVIKGNSVKCVTGQFGIVVKDNIPNVHVVENSVDGDDLTKGILTYCSSIAIKGNTFRTGNSTLLALGAADELNVPDGLEFFAISTTTPIQGIRTQSMKNVSDGIPYCTLSNGGSGYTSRPTVSFTGGGGSGAAGFALVNAGVVVGIRMTAFGSGYTSAPTVGFSGGGGSGAAATATWKLQLPERYALEFLAAAAVTVKRNGTLGPVLENPASIDLSVPAAGYIKLRAASGQWRLASKNY